MWHPHLRHSYFTDGPLFFALFFHQPIYHTLAEGNLDYGHPTVLCEGP